MNRLPWLLPLALLITVFLYALNSAYPMIGHDYFYFMPRLLAGRLHFAQQGITPFMYTPYFCGGIPQYGNPQGMYYSLQQILTLMMNPWIAVQGAMIFYLLIGYIGWYLFGRDIVRLPAPWAHLLSVVVLANGYYMLHMAVGHIASLTLPIAGFLLWLLLARAPDTKNQLIVKSAAFALLSAAAIYSGGYLVVLYAGMGFLLALPFEFALCGEKFKARLRVLVPRVAACAAAALLLCASKLVAAWSLMRFFPRELPFKIFPEDQSVLLFVVRALFELPQKQMVFQLNEIGVHDYSVWVSPIVVVGLLYGIWRFKQVASGKWSVTRLFRLRECWLAVYISLLCLFFLQLTNGHGILVDWLQPLPLFKSLHVTTRFLYIPAVMLSVAGVFGLQRMTHVFFSKSFPSFHSFSSFPSFLSVLTIATFLLTYHPILTSSLDLLWRTVDLNAVQEINDRRDGKIMPLVHEVVDIKMVSGFMSVYDGLTNIQCTEPLFGTLFGGGTVGNAGKVGNAGSIQEATELLPGLVTQTYDGAFNLHNPACFMYPEENGCEPWDRIALDDSHNLFQFVEGKSVTWKQSTLQHVSNWVSFVMGVLCLVPLAYLRWHVVRS